MKKFIFLCLVVCGFVAAQGATHNNSNSDKPSRLYVDSDTQNFNYNWNSIAYDYYVGGAHIVVGTASGAHTYNHTWNDGAGGGGNWSSDHTDSTDSDTDPLYTGSDHYHVDGQFSWPATFWPTLTNCTETDTGDTWLLGWANIDVGLDPLQSDDLPLIEMEHCQVKDTENSSTGTNIYNHFDFSRTAQTKMKLQTGGKALSNRKNLFAFNGSATAILANFAIPPFQNLPTQSIPAQNVTIGSVGTLGSDGNLYAALPDNQTFDVTPTVSSQKFYTFAVSASKHTLTILASSSTTNTDLSTDTPEFCVGQTLAFVPSWDSDPPNVADITSHWHLPGKFVNEPYAYSDYCDSYRLNSDLLTNRTISCWYVNAPGGACSMFEILHFSNGQYVSVAAAGNFTVYRPTVQFNSGSAGPIAIQSSGQSSPPNVLAIGGITFSATVTSTDFSGSANWVQLINRYVAGDYAGLYNYNTLGGYWLDNDLFYNTTGGDENGVGGSPDPTSAGPGQNTPVPFSDNPQIGCYPTYVSISDSFKTYLVFKPNGDGIWVTLGRVTWGWSGSATVEEDGGATLVPSDCNILSPTYTDTDEFPVWSHIYSNSR